MIKQIIIALSTLCLFVQCDHKTLFQEYKVIDNEIWERTNPVEFQVVIPNNGLYCLSIALRHTSNYPISNLWYTVDIDQGNTNLRRDTCHLQIAESDGRWIGDGGAIKTIVQPIGQSPIQLPGDTLTIRLQHVMSDRKLSGIRDVGIEINKMNE